MQFKGHFKKAIDHVDKYFPENTELIVVLSLLSWGIVTLMPVELLPGSVYQYNAAKIPFGILLSAPCVYLLALRLRHGVVAYSNLIWKRRQGFFFIFVAFIYLTALSAGIDLWPPRFLLYLSQAAIAILCYLRLANK